jgi:hypothetical protein
MKELIERVKKTEKTISTWRNNHLSKEWKEANEVNIFLAGIPLNRQRGCQCIEDLFFLIKRSNINQVIKIEMSRKFVLKPGKVVMLHGCTPITDKASDEQLIKLLKLSPAHLVNFVSYPENWEEICGVKPKTKPKAAAVEKERLAQEARAAEAEAKAEAKAEPKAEANSDRKNELLELKNDDLKNIILDEQKQELPDNKNKENLIDCILAFESEQ